jgi:hypothetical protein
VVPELIKKVHYLSVCSGFDYTSLGFVSIIGRAILLFRLRRGDSVCGEPSSSWLTFVHCSSPWAGPEWVGGVAGAHLAPDGAKVAG